MFSKKKEKKNGSIKMYGFDEWFNAVFLDKPFNEIKRFLDVFLVNKFYELNNSFLESLKLKELDVLVSEFNLFNDSYLTFSNKTIDAYLNSYSNGKYIFSIEIKKPQEFFNVNTMNDKFFPFKIFVCFDLINPKMNMFYAVYKYTIELLELRILTNKVRDASISYNLGSNYLSNKFPKITIKEIEDRFGADNLIYSIDKVPDSGFNNIYHLYETIKKITYNFNKTVSLDEIITFTLMLNDIKYCSTEEKTKDFDKRALIFNKFGKKLKVNSIKPIEEIRNEYFLLLQNPDKYIVGQSFRLMPKDDLPRLSKLVNNPFGLALLFFIDRIFLKTSKAEELMNLIIFDYSFFIEKMILLIDLRSSILQEITNFIETEIIDLVW